MITPQRYFGVGQRTGPRHAVIANQIRPWWWHQCGQLFDQLRGAQQQGCGPVRPRRFQTELQGLRVHEAQPASRLDQPRRRVGHAPAQARRTETPLLAGERHHPALTTILAAYPQEPVTQNATFQVGAQLLLDMSGELVVGSAQAFKEGLQVSGQDLVQGLSLGRAAAIGDGGHAARVGGLRRVPYL